MPEIYDFPREWWHFTAVTVPLVSRRQIPPGPWAGGNSIYGPHAQIWMPKLTASIQDIDTCPLMDAFFSRLGGQAGLLRMGDPSRISPRYNRLLVPPFASWSDGSTFTDGSGFASSLLPPTCFLSSAANRGDTSVVIGGLPVSTANVLSRGDLFEVRPNGIPSKTPNLYQVMVDGPTNSSGQAGVEIRPPL